MVGCESGVVGCESGVVGCESGVVGCESLKVLRVWRNTMGD